MVWLLGTFLTVTFVYCFYAGVVLPYYRAKYRCDVRRIRHEHFLHIADSTSWADSQVAQMLLERYDISLRSRAHLGLATLLLLFFTQSEAINEHLKREMEMIDSAPEWMKELKNKHSFLTLRKACLESPIISLFLIFLAPLALLTFAGAAKFNRLKEYASFASSIDKSFQA